MTSDVSKYQDETVIEPGGGVSRYWRELWSYRELFLFLSWRDILVRYKQTLLGVSWCVVRPLITMFVFTAIFHKLAKLPSGNVPYPVMVYTALLPWQLFAASFQEGSNSLIGAAGMISKVYFPRIIIPATAIMSGMVDFLISLVLFFGLMIMYHVMPTARLLYLPLLIALTILPSLGASLWISSLNVRYRDFKYIVPFIIQLGLYISPVGFSSAIVPQRWRFAYSLNPMVGVIDGFRWMIEDDSSILFWPGFILSCIISGVTVVSGFWYFRKVERSFADII